MSDAITPGKTITFTITRSPSRTADQKTLRRLMQMQPAIQKGLSYLSRRRRQQDNDPRRRAGLIWVHRKRATKLVRPEAGETFTLTVTPQIVPDLNAVSKFITAG